MPSKRMSAGRWAAGLILIAAGGALFAQVRSGNYGSQKTGSLAQTVGPELTPDAEYHVNSFPSFPVDLAEGEGQAETQSFCAMCHSTRYITMQPSLPAVVWEAEVNKMIKTYGAPIPEVSAKKITSYLQAHYTPETRRH
jgi:hypothetical protein